MLQNESATKVPKSSLNKYFPMGIRTYQNLLLFLLFSLLLQPLAVHAGGSDTKDEPIVERVEVRNIQVPVRVFNKNNAVKDLKKEDFELFVDGKKTSINGFFEMRNRLEESVNKKVGETGEPVNAQPRLFVLLFNLSDYHQDMMTAMDVLFNSVIRINDRIIVITNRFFISEWVVMDLEASKKKVQDTLMQEIAKLKLDVNWFEAELKSMAATVKSRLEDPEEKRNPDFPTAIFEDFFMNYKMVIDDIRDHYLKLPVAQYIKISEYLKGQRVQKWVLNFYQISHFPLLNTFGTVNTAIQEYMDPNKQDDVAEQADGSVGSRLSSSQTFDVKGKSAARNLQTITQNFESRLRQYDDLMTKDIGKAFLNTGATFHTLLLKPINPGFSDDFKYEPVATETEVILKKISNLTGGSIMRSNKMQAFVKEITTREDVVYTLTYVPEGKGTKKKAPVIEVKLKKGDYRVVYDDQKRMRAYRYAKKKLDLDNPDVEIEAVTFNNNMLKVKLKNIKMIDYEGDTYGAVQARVRISNNKDATLVRDFQKVYKGIKKEGVFHAQLPLLEPGNYSILLEVKDLFSLKNTIAGEAVNIEKK